VLAVGLVASGCSKKEDTTASSGDIAKQPKLVIDKDGKAKGPAAEIKGAKKGGVVNVLNSSDFEYIGNAQNVYVGATILVLSHLFSRSLTSYIEPAKPGDDLQLVGDLATNTGETNDNGKTWKFTLRDGITFEDGSPITSKDIAYGVARSFNDEQGSQGPQYIQNWLQPDRSYKGPYNGGSALPPGVTTPDDKTIIFTFPEAHADFPLAAALPTTVPVPKAKDTGNAYDRAWVSSGPYKLKPGSYKKDASMVLIRNDKWKPESDPIRHQYADEFHFAYDVTDTSQAQRLLADAGDDQTAMMFADNIPVEQISQVNNNDSVKNRTIDGFTVYARYIYINTQRVKDVDVRRGLNYAFDRDAYIKVIGGSKAGAPSHTLASPTLPGYKSYNAYPAPESGDVKKAKELFKGKNVPALNYCFSNTPRGQKTSASVKVGLERAGITVNLKPVDSAAYYKTVGTKTTTCDLIVGGWGMDYADANTVYQPLFDGTTIRATGNQNLSYLNESDVNAKIKEIGSELDRVKANEDGAKLDKMIMEKYAPVIPTIYDRQYGLYGSKIGGTTLSPLYGVPTLANVYVK